jgi:hypothetical protein
MNENDFRLKLLWKWVKITTEVCQNNIVRDEFTSMTDVSEKEQLRNQISSKIYLT